MITDKTVFILGAGASKPYGFPTALELRRDIIKSYPDMLKRAHSEYYKVDIAKIDFPRKLENLIQTFEYSSTKSIDLFLARNKQFYEDGKKIITFLIANYEMKSKFREDIEKPEFDWYMHIYDILTKHISNPENLASFFENNNVSFITFNYDRSLEQFLYESFFNSFATKRNEIVKLFSKIKILHIYGKIAALPFENSYFNVPYSSPSYFGYLEDLAKNIKIVFEERTDDLGEAKQLISEAQRIYFLGFGYADENLQVLDFNNLLNRGHRIYGTGKDLTEIERRKIVSKLKGKNAQVISELISIEDCDSVMLLRRHLG